MGLPQPVQRLTEAEYLAIERAAEFKSEFFDGEMFAMAGGTPMHSLIATNAGREFGNRLKGRPCVPFNGDLRIKVEATGLYTYPDLSVICGPLRYVTEEHDTIVNPTVLVEVLSDSTESYDRGKKFENYRRIPTLKEYLLVSQKEPRLEQFIRQDTGEWLLREAAGLEAKIELPSLQITIELSEVFANVEFTPEPIRAPVARSH
ncbi:MAG: Uma2 family endonuclease [Verrucomicrobia bacterium]|nr:Uma2 family endonuclease [Verrucomicrobiota bacterium]